MLTISLFLQEISKNARNLKKMKGIVSFKHPPPLPKKEEG
jgi:hypothetical protein